MKITILGTGTSCGVPQIGCPCEVCTSTDSRDKRLRCSALVEVDGKNILIDCGPDFRQQMLNIDFRPIDAILITHEHYDHVGGIDDLRPYCIFGDVDIYAEKFCADHLMERIPYCFTPQDKRYPGVPALNLIPIRPHEPIVIRHKERQPMSEAYLEPPIIERRRQIIEKMEKSRQRNTNLQDEGLEIMPIRVMHGKLPIVGFRIRNFAYMTDMKTIPDEEYAYLDGVETLIVNGLRHTPHPTHQTIEEAIDFSRKIGAKKTYLIHMNHHIRPHAIEQEMLPPQVYLAYDFMQIEC